MYGTQALKFMKPTYLVFENDVKMYGTQAKYTYNNLDL